MIQYRGEGKGQFSTIAIPFGELNVEMVEDLVKCDQDTRPGVYSTAMFFLTNILPHAVFFFPSSGVCRVRFLCQ